MNVIRCSTSRDETARLVSQNPADVFKQAGSFTDRDARLTVLRAKYDVAADRTE
jgi:hypothetical protein